MIELPSKIKLDDFLDVGIRVGEVEHSNQNDHFIHWIKIYVDDLYLTRTDFTPVMTKPEITLSLKIVPVSEKNPHSRSNALQSAWNMGKH